LAQGLGLGVGAVGIVADGTRSLASPVVITAAVVGVEASAGVGGRARTPQPAPGPSAAPGARGSGGAPRTLASTRSSRGDRRALSRGGDGVGVRGEEGRTGTSSDWGG